VKGMSIQIELRKLTLQLCSYNQQVLSIAERVRQNDEEPDFFLHVKPFADKVKQTGDLWKKFALQWIQAEHPKYIHSRQIETVCENIEKISIEAFYKTTSMKRIKQFHQSVEYTLNMFLMHLPEVSQTL